MLARSFAALGRLFPPKFVQRLARLRQQKAKLVAPPIPKTTVIPTPTVKIAKVRPVEGSVRTGLLGYKIGCTAHFDAWGVRHLVTVVKLHNLYVSRVKTIARNGYEAVVLSSGMKPLKNCNKPEIGQAIKQGKFPAHKISEFRVSSENLLPTGTCLSVRHFVPGQWIFVAGHSKARGWLGAKRSWHMGGQSKTHGTTKGENNAGSIGQGKGIGKVWKYKRMDGHRGNDPRVVNCKLMKAEAGRELLFFKGVVPGEIGSVVRLWDARGKTALKNRHIKLPFPTYVGKPGETVDVVVEQPVIDRDPFLFPDKIVNEKRVKS